jgi:Skp family chaperone for outer membrane proteins
MLAAAHGHRRLRGNRRMQSGVQVRNPSMRAQALLAAVACLTVTLLAGCNRQQNAAESVSIGAVAVIDLDAIAQRLGSDKQIAESITKRQTSLSQQLVDLAKSYNQQIEDQKKKLAEAQAEQGEVTLANWQQQANANLNKVKQQAQIDLQKHKAALVAQFREEIKPAARRVAQARGMSVIVTKNDSVLYDFAPAADITDAVVSELLAHRTAAQTAPIQK